MSDPVSPLSSAVFQGVVTVTEAGLRGMISLKGDLSDTALRNAATGVTGLDFPDTGQANCVGQNGLCWMAPDEVLILLEYDKVPDALSAIETTLSGSHFLAANVSDARASFQLAGAPGDLRDTLSKLTPADMRPANFPTGQIRRTRLAQVAAALWFHEENLVEIICFRSTAHYVFELLRHAAQNDAILGHYGAIGTPTD